MSPTSEKRSLLGEAQSKSDLLMMCTLKGKERGRTQWKDLLSSSGFHLDKIVSTRTPYSVIVATPSKCPKFQALEDLKVLEPIFAAVPA